MPRTPGRFGRLVDILEDLHIYQGVRVGVLADVFELNRRTITTRFSEHGIQEVAQLRERDSALDKKLELILLGLLPLAEARGLDDERLAQLRAAGFDLSRL